MKLGHPTQTDSSRGFLCDCEIFSEGSFEALAGGQLPEQRPLPLLRPLCKTKQRSEAARSDGGEAVTLSGAWRHRDQCRHAHTQPGVVCYILILKYVNYYILVIKFSCLYFFVTLCFFVFPLALLFSLAVLCPCSVWLKAPCWTAAASGTEALVWSL